MIDFFHSNNHVDCSTDFRTKFRASSLKLINTSAAEQVNKHFAPARIRALFMRARRCIREFALMGAVSNDARRDEQAADDAAEAARSAARSGGRKATAPSGASTAAAAASGARMILEEGGAGGC